MLTPFTFSVIIHMVVLSLISLIAFSFLHFIVTSILFSSKLFEHYFSIALYLNYEIFTYTSFFTSFIVELKRVKFHCTYVQHILYPSIFNSLQPIFK